MDARITDRRNRTEHVVAVPRYELPDKLADVIEWLQGVLAGIPAEHRGTTDFDLEEDDGAVTVEISYRRPETDEEYEERVNFMIAGERLTEKTEREQYEALKKKYG